ncbi:hypothetical protein GCM10018966_095590 [Streptomyces yanii]
MRGRKRPIPPPIRPFDRRSDDDRRGSTRSVTSCDAKLHSLLGSYSILYINQPDPLANDSLNSIRYGDLPKETPLPHPRLRVRLR